MSTLGRFGMWLVRRFKAPDGYVCEHGLVKHGPDRCVYPESARPMWLGESR